MRHFFLPDVEHNPNPGGPFAGMIKLARERGAEMSPIWLLCGFKPDAMEFLMPLTHQVMRGPSPLSPGMRELIAAFTSARNHCVY